MTTTINPEDDGVEHLNTATHSRVWLGRILSNFAHTPFTHSEYGWFASMEAYYYYHATGKQHEGLRSLHGWKAKAAGKQFPKVIMEQEDFEQVLYEGLECKILQNPNIANALFESYLPFQHYYVYGDPPNCKVIEPKGSFWLVFGLGDIRRKLKLVCGKVDGYVRLFQPKMVLKEQGAESESEYFAGI